MPIVFRTSNAEAHADMYAYKYPTLLAHAERRASRRICLDDTYRMSIYHCHVQGYY